MTQRKLHDSMSQDSENDDFPRPQTSERLELGKILARPDRLKGSDGHFDGARQGSSNGRKHLHAALKFGLAAPAASGTCGRPRQIPLIAFLIARDGSGVCAVFDAFKCGLTSIDDGATPRWSAATGGSRTNGVCHAERQQQPNSGHIHSTDDSKTAADSTVQVWFTWRQDPRCFSGTNQILQSACMTTTCGSHAAPYRCWRITSHRCEGRSKTGDSGLVPRQAHHPAKSLQRQASVFSRTNAYKLSASTEHMLAAYHV